MFKVFKVVKKRREIILSEKDVMTVLKVLDEVSQETRRGILLMDMEIGRCDLDVNSKWFVQFNISDKHWSSTIDKLEELNRQLVLKDDLRFYLK